MLNFPDNSQGHTSEDGGFPGTLLSVSKNEPQREKIGRIEGIRETKSAKSFRLVDAENFIIRQHVIRSADFSFSFFCLILCFCVVRPLSFSRSPNRYLIV